MKKLLLVLFALQFAAGCAWSVQNMPYPEEAPWQDVPAQRGHEHRDHHRPDHGHHAPAKPGQPGHHHDGGHH